MFDNMLFSYVTKLKYTFKLFPNEVRYVWSQINFRAFEKYKKDERDSVILNYALKKDEHMYIVIKCVLFTDMFIYIVIE